MLRKRSLSFYFLCSFFSLISQKNYFEWLPKELLFEIIQSQTNDYDKIALIYTLRKVDKKFKKNLTTKEVNLFLDQLKTQHYGHLLERTLSKNEAPETILSQLEKTSIAKPEFLWLLKNKPTFKNKLSAFYKQKFGFYDHPFIYACRSSHLWMIKILLNDNIINLRDMVGITPLSWSAIRGLASIAEILVRNPKIKINQPDNAGNTALMHAVIHNKPDLVKLLLEFRADPEIANNLGMTPLQWARYRGFSNIISLLEPPNP